MSPVPKARMTVSLRNPGVRSITNDPTDSSGLAGGCSTAATSSPAPIAAAAAATPAAQASARRVPSSVTPDSRPAGEVAPAPARYFFSALITSASALPATHTNGMPTASSATGFAWNRTPRLSPTYAPIGSV